MTFIKVEPSPVVVLSHLNYVLMHIINCLEADRSWNAVSLKTTHAFLASRYSAGSSAMEFFHSAGVSNTILMVISHIKKDTHDKEEVTTLQWRSHAEAALMR